MTPTQQIVLQLLGEVWLWTSIGFLIAFFVSHTIGENK